MTAIERFKELLKTATPEARLLVNTLIEVGPHDFWDAIVINRDTPQAAEPVSEECELKTGMHVGLQTPPLYAWPKDKRFHHGDRVRVTKIEEPK
jgi:hypothetical protein